MFALCHVSEFPSVSLFSAVRLILVPLPTSLAPAPPPFPPLPSLLNHPFSIGFGWPRPCTGHSSPFFSLDSPGSPPDTHSPVSTLPAPFAPPCYSSHTSSSSTLPPRRRRRLRRRRNNTIGDAGAATLTGAVARLRALKMLVLE